MKEKKESIQQHPAKEANKGVKTPEPPQVKDPSKLPATDKGKRSEEKE